MALLAGTPVNGRIREPRAGCNPWGPRLQPSPGGGGNVVKELTTQGNPKPQPPPGGLERERHKPQQIPQGCTSTRERMWNVPAREGFLAGGQLTQGPLNGSEFKCDSHYHSPGQCCCQTRRCFRLPHSPRPAMTKSLYTTGTWLRFE